MPRNIRNISFDPAFDQELEQWRGLASKANAEVSLKDLFNALAHLFLNEFDDEQRVEALEGASRELRQRGITPGFEDVYAALQSKRVQRNVDFDDDLDKGLSDLVALWDKRGAGVSLKDIFNAAGHFFLHLTIVEQVELIGRARRRQMRNFVELGKAYALELKAARQRNTPAASDPVIRRPRQRRKIGNSGPGRAG